MTDYNSRLNGHFIGKLSRIFALSAAGLGFIALVGWITSTEWLTSFRPGGIPMAPSTALLFFLFGSALPCRTNIPASLWCSRLSALPAWVGFGLSIILLALSLRGVYLPVEHLGMNISGVVQGAPVGHMSPITAFLFLITGCAVLLLSPVHRQRNVASFWLAASIVLTGMILVVGYLVDAPLFYGTATIPPAMTTSMAFLLLGIALVMSAGLHAWPSRHYLADDASTGATIMLLLVFILLAAGILGAGYLYSQHQQSQFRSRVEAELSAVADLKTGQIQQWRRERLGDASLFFKNSAFSEMVRRVLENSGDEEAREYLQIWLEKIKNQPQYIRISLSDATGAEQFVVPAGSGETLSGGSLEVAYAMTSRQVSFIDLHRKSPDLPPQLVIVVPILAAPDWNTVLGFLTLGIDPEQELYPLIQSWPTPSRSAETLLVRRDGDSVLFLNDLQFQKNAALNLRLPLTRHDLPAAMAVQGKVGIVEGIDYRQQPVIAAIRAVPNAPWFMVARMDLDEINRPLRERLFGITGLLCTFLLSAGAIVGFIWRNQRAHFYRLRYEAAQAAEESAGRFEHLNRVLRAIRNINQLIVKVESVDELIRNACTSLVDCRSYTSAMIILTDENDQPIAHAEASAGVDFQPLIKQMERGTIPPCCAAASLKDGVFLIRGKDPLCVPCSLASVCVSPQRMSIRLEHQHKIYGYLAVSVDIDINMDTEEERLLVELAGDLAYSLHNMEMGRLMHRAEIENKRLEAQFIQAQKMEAVGRLAGGVAHDFNNLLTIIIGYATILAEGVTPDSSFKEPLAEIYDAAIRAKNLTRQLLAFSRKQTLEIQIVDVNQVIDSFEKLLRRSIGEDIRMHLALAAEPVLVEADISQLEQILMNLAINARDAMPDGGLLTIETARINLDEGYAADRPGVIPGSYVMIGMSDNGCGMDQITQSRIFEPFFTTKEMGKGTGLGLSTVYGVVKQHNGNIWVYSEPGLGTTFKIYLPAVDEAAAPIEQKKIKEMHTTQAETILVVEDESALRKLACRILLRNNYKVLEAMDTDDAIAIAARYSEPIHLLLTDVIMPMMKGTEVFKKVAEFHPAIRVLYMSGYTENVIAHHGVLKDGIHFIQKPFTEESLLEKVHTTIRS